MQWRNRKRFRFPLLPFELGASRQVQRDVNDVQRKLALQFRHREIICWIEIRKQVECRFAVLLEVARGAQIGSGETVPVVVMECELVHVNEEPQKPSRKKQDETGKQD